MNSTEDKLIELGYEKVPDNPWDYIKHTSLHNVKICISLPSSFVNKNPIENAYIKVDKYIIFNFDDVDDLYEIIEIMESDLHKLGYYDVNKE